MQNCKDCPHLYYLESIVSKGYFDKILSPRWMCSHPLSRDLIGVVQIDFEWKKELKIQESPGWCGLREENQF